MPSTDCKAAHSTSYLLSPGSSISEFSFSPVTSPGYREISGAYAALISDLADLLAINFTGPVMPGYGVSMAKLAVP